MVKRHLISASGEGRHIITLIKGFKTMKKYLEIAVVAIVAVAVGKKLPVVQNYL